MPGRLGPRFAIEALFLIALAVGAAYADLERKWIVLVMAGGWLVVAILELTADRIWAAAPPWRRPYYMAAPPPPQPEAAATSAEPAAPPAEPAAPPAEPAPPPPEPEPRPEPAVVSEPLPEPEQPEEPEPVPIPEPEPEAATIITRPVETAALAPDDGADRPAEPEPASGPPTLEPLDARPKRRWLRRRKHEEPDVEAPLPEPPKHVRLLSPSEQKGDEPGEITETFDTTKPEERSRR